MALRRRSEAIKAATAPLAKAIEDNQQKEALETANPRRWASANAAKEEGMDVGFQAITERVFVKDPLSEYERLEKAMVIGDKRNDYGVVMRCLDEAEGNARMAHRLWQSAIVERKRWELNNEVVFSAMRDEATKTLQHEKQAGTRAKQVTDADVDSRVALLYPDEYKAQEVRRARSKAMVDSMGNLVEVWLSRCRTLQTLASKLR
jgi:hypothetical protein